MNIETLGIIISKRPYQEDRVLLDLFTECHGKITVMVNRGRRSQYSDQIFQLGRWQLKTGKVFFFVNDFDSIRISHMTGLKIWSAYYLNELLMRLLPYGQADAALFSQYWHVIQHLESADNILHEWLLRNFERTLLESLGIMPDFGWDSDGDELTQHHYYYLTIDGGISKRKPNQTPSLLISGAHIIAINDITETDDYEAIHSDLLLTYKRMMRFLLKPLLGGKPLQSKLWLQNLYLKQQERDKRSFS